MWNSLSLKRLDWRPLPIIALLMGISLITIAFTTAPPDVEEFLFFTPHVKRQLQRFGVGILCYLFFAGFDYRKLREWGWIFYVSIILLLLGLFFTEPIQNVHRWYRIPFVEGGTFQPSEYAKLALVLTLSWFLERKGEQVGSWRAFFHSSLFILIPFFLILKQPDLGSAMVLYPMTLGMLYFGGIRPLVVRMMAGLGVAMLILISLIFTEVIDHESLRPFALRFLKRYQYERFDPHTYHHQAAQTAIGVGGVSGSGFKKSLFTGHHFLPAAHTDSVFPAFVEQFGILGAILLLLLFFLLIYCSLQVTAVARDQFGRVLSAGIAIYIAIHALINIGMMCGFLPITGVPLPLVTYGGSSVTLTLSALGILQSVYARRFMF